MAAEKNFEDRVKRFLKEQGAWFIKYWGGAAFTKAGVPDILACVNGHFIGIDLKAPNGKATDLQLHTLKQIDTICKHLDYPIEKIFLPNVKIAPECSEAIDELMKSIVKYEQ